MLRNIIIEGVDRMGKGTLISGLKNAHGFFQVIHFEKPERLDYYKSDTDRHQLEFYQRHSYRHMFQMLRTGRFILDRAHLGEAVYAKRYRGYDGDYVFSLEQDENFDRSGVLENTLLVLLTTSDFSFIQDDGLSLDFSKKEEEQDDFKRAFEKSIFRNKLMIDVSNRAGGYRDAKEILNLVSQKFRPESPSRFIGI